MCMFTIFSTPHDWGFFVFFFHHWGHRVRDAWYLSEAHLGSQQWDSNLQSPFRKMETALQAHMEERGADMSKQENPDCSFWRWVWQTANTPRSSLVDELLEFPSGNSIGWVKLTGALNMTTLQCNFQKQTPFLSYNFFPKFQTQLSSWRSHEFLKLNTSRMNVSSLPPPRWHHHSLWTPMAESWL